jgi:uncharacterized protein with HEPN domain
VRRAVERLLSIIGEAATRFERDAHDDQLSDKQQIKGLRNRIIHVYDDLDHETIWGIIVVYIPTLKTEVEQLLKHT